VSLRLLDWLVTNYSKRLNITYTIERNGVASAFNVFIEYKAILRAYSKRNCDPFCRRERIRITNSDGQQQDTTVAQLCFMRWAMQHGVLEYASRHKAAIEQDMLAVAKTRTPSPTGSDQGNSSGSNNNSNSPYDNDCCSGSPNSTTPSKRHELSTAAVKSCTKSLCHVTVRFK
jgi:hypothetical protein